MPASQISKSDLYSTWNLSPEMAELIRFPFKGSNKIRKNYSQSYQDLFVVSMLNGLQNGLYLEIGAHKPVENNNTFLLESVFGWKGVSIELDSCHLGEWRDKRPDSQIIITDALKLNYHNLLSSLSNAYSQTSSKDNFFKRIFSKSPERKNRIDYLQLDIDPSMNTLAVLKLLPLNDFRFSVITFETDAYSRDFRAQAESRLLLLSHGYELVAPDILVQYDPISHEPIPFEDWWVDPTVVDKNFIKQLTTNPWSTTKPQDVIFKI